MEFVYKETNNICFFLDIFISLIMATGIAEMLQFNKCLINNLFSFYSINYECQYQSSKETKIFLKIKIKIELDFNLVRET